MDTPKFLPESLDDFIGRSNKLLSYNPNNHEFFYGNAALKMDIEAEFRRKIAEINELIACDGITTVVNNAMYPLLAPGDIVFYEAVGKVFYGGMYFVQFTVDGQVHKSIKYVHQSFSPDFYRLECNNPFYEPEDIPKESVQLLAAIKACVRKF